MDDGENIFPLDITEREPGQRPWKFRPEGYLVVMLPDEDEAKRAEAALVAGGFASNDIKLYPGEQILATFEIYKAQRDLADKVVGAVTDDVEGRDLYLDYAREGRCALWLRVPDEFKVPKALRVLADREYLHTRYYGVKTETDYHVSQPAE
jgi:hypothetical protein